MFSVKGEMNMQESIKNIIRKALTFIFLAVITFISVLPIFWVVISSFKSTREITSSPLSLPTSFSFDGYLTAISVSPIFQYYGNSIIVSVAATLLNLIFMGMAAYVFARVKSKFINVLLAVMSVTLFIPITSMMQSIYSVIEAIGLYDTKTGLVLVYTAIGIPITLFVLRSFFLTIPKEIEESAYIDGASFVRTFFSIIVPIARPGFATAAIIQFINCWNEFLFALTLTSSNENRTVPLVLNYFTSMFSYDYTALFAALTMIVIPSIIIFILLQEQVVSGLSSGSVKG
ncbi:carbohydrate ABC transporter permease [Cytobacillus oceanisediminis]|uniref:Carbohydrate ABC transporter membrane protein 2, CUT1 family (TC 3.A.1.1.-) n=2 Tax=Cytobacillus oceanisediminis TaxID=665099 RepID=A0A562J499_9BACI|nr:carbohydrate ABC transporter membrane protein 2, CUT1 family (TC 3.A.1.1.-) [Cytobacillus oceanisediminis]